MNDRPPQIENAPGLKWRRIQAGWQASWRARSDLIGAGYKFKSMRVWESTKANPEPDEATVLFIQTRCQEYQDEMLVWARGGVPEPMGIYDATWGALVHQYRTDPDSPYHKKRFASRQHYDTLCRRIDKDCGATKIAETDARKLLRLHEGWSDNGKKVTMGHSMIGMMRTITTFGATILKCADCKAVRSDLHDMRVKAGKPRDQQVTADHARAICRKARSMREPFRYSLALGQALQFELTLRQKDVIGEWVPIEEKNVPPTDILSGNKKWVRGIRAEEIDENFILRHMTSKRDKMIVADLKLAPMVMEHFRFMAGLSTDQPLLRGHIPTSGPLIVNEQTGVPWESHNYRYAWRRVARACGMPDNVKNMDSRAGAITESFASGADPDDTRKGATHSNLSMTQRYSRGDEEAVARVMQHRAAHRNKTGTDGGSNT